jgi:hypothetical protein
MAEQSKFAGALGKLSKRSAAKATPTPAGRGGKRSNPEFSPTTFFVRRETKRKAARLLEDTNAGKDLSDLVEELLTNWTAQTSKRANL